RGTAAADAARWNRCESIRWGIDTTMLRKKGVSPAKELKRWKGVFNEAAAASGYTFDFKGTIDGKAGLVANESFGTGGRRDIAESAYDQLGGLNLVITNAVGKQSGKYAEPAFKSAGVAGIGGAFAVQGSDLKLIDGRPGRSQITSGFVTINVGTVKRVTKRKKTRGEARQLYLHELGHALGLGHVKDRRQAMYPSTSASQKYGAGDRNGLRQLANATCFQPQSAQPASDWNVDDSGDDDLATSRSDSRHTDLAASHERVNITRFQ
ncbi:MAG: matrixin family metalloprotease, partial [Candidatus Nanopelagicales bacterium]